MKKIYLLFLLLLSFEALSQANFNGNVYDNESKKALKNVKLMVIEEMDTSYIVPDEKGDFNFKTKPGRVKIYTVADGFISEMNSMNAGDGSTNVVNIALVKEEMVELYAKEAESRPAKHLFDSPKKSESYGEASSYTRSDIGDPGAYAIKSGELKNSNGATKGGVLTAGEVNDFAKWDLWNDLTENEFKLYSTMWNDNLSERFCVQLSLPTGMPIIDAQIELKNDVGTIVWVARTDNTGKAELWVRDSTSQSRNKYEIEVVIGEFRQTFKNIRSFKNGVNSFKIDVPCTVSDQLDIAFVVDATGSMGDEISYLKMDLDSVISMISAENKNINVRMGSVFYRDNDDEYVTREAPFSNNTELIKSFINSNEANGGGDFPEAADEALMTALTNLNWSSSSRARIIFWVLDAPPHRAEENLIKLLEVTQLAAKMGVKIVPVGCSGIDKPTEYLCRSIALATNGTYTFLTNHSGIGGNHIEPSTDGYKVESFREVLVRVARLMSITPDCDEFIAPEQIVSIDTNLLVINPYGTEDSLYVNRTIDTLETSVDLEILLYPNPTNGVFNIQSPKEITEVFIADVNGKLLERVQLNEDRITTCDISQYSIGVYFVQYYNGNRWAVKRLVLHH